MSVLMMQLIAQGLMVGWWKKCAAGRHPPTAGGLQNQTIQLTPSNSSNLPHSFTLITITRLTTAVKIVITMIIVIITIIRIDIDHCNEWNNWLETRRLHSEVGDGIKKRKMKYSNEIFIYDGFMNSEWGKEAAKANESLCIPNEIFLISRSAHLHNDVCVCVCVCVCMCVCVLGRCLWTVVLGFC